MRLYLVILLLFFFLSCAQKEEYTEEEDFASVYASTLEIQGEVLECSTFHDDTFQGKVNLVKNQKDCFDVEISKFPDNFFETENIFLQAYPFFMRERDTDYGESLPLIIYEKRGASKPLIKSPLVDSFLINQIGSSPKDFFEEHYLRLCDLTKDWDAVQLVTYLRRNDYDQPSVVRTTRFLLPPFLANPQHFKQERGDALFVYHPFFNLKNTLDIEPSSYYKISKSVCN